jgi:predicted nucleotidyltransferase
MSDSNHRKAFQELAENLEDELGDDLRKLVLYGSVARGEETEESDVDVLIVIADEALREKVEEIVFDASVENEVFIVPLIKTLDDFEEKKDTIFMKEVQRTGEAYV